MARYRNGLKEATRIFEAAAWQYSVRVSCRCGHSSTFGAHGLWWLFMRRRWDDRFDAARARFWCRRCSTKGRKVRPIGIDLVNRSDQDFRFPDPDEREWKRAVNRFRG